MVRLPVEMLDPFFGRVYDRCYTNRALTTAETIVELVLEQAEQYALAA